MKKWVMLLLCAGVFLASAACGESEGARSAAPGLGVYERDGALIVALEGNPTTGYEWLCESDLAEGCLSGGEREYTPYPATELEAGTGGVFAFRFEPVAAGAQTLRFAYRRSWEETGAIETYELTVTVCERAKGFALDWE